MMPSPSSQFQSCCPETMGSLLDPAEAAGIGMAGLACVERALINSQAYMGIWVSKMSQIFQLRPCSLRQYLRAEPGSPLPSLQHLKGQGNGLAQGAEGLFCCCCCCCVHVGCFPGRFFCLIFTLNPPSSSFPGSAKPSGYGGADDALQWPAVTRSINQMSYKVCVAYVCVSVCVCMHKLTCVYLCVCLSK